VTSRSGALRRTSGSTPSGTAPTGDTAAPLPSTPPAQPSRAELTALASVLEAERAAVYGYGVVGGQVARAHREQAAARREWHARGRDALAAQLSLAGEPAPAGPAAYALPFEVDTDASALALGVQLELGVAAAYADLVAAAAASRRAPAAKALSDCAVAAQQWHAVVDAFPGLPERRDG
jgi:hypothetical protein